MRNLKVALVHDYLREYGGAERVVETLHEMFPQAPLYTAFVDKEALGIHWTRFADWDIRESVAAKIPGIKKLYSPLRLFSAYFFEGFDLSSYDVVISSTNMYMAKAVLTRPETLHLCYIHTPPRSLYGYTTASNWKKNIVVRIFGELLNFRMRQIDFVTSQRPDIPIANSKVVQERIQKYYRRDAIVIYPPVSIQIPQVREDGKYYLYVNRLAYAKHPELAVAACSRLNLPLKVVGVGRMMDKLHAMAGKTIEFLGAVDDVKLSQVYARATAVLYPVEDEDFGMIPVEAMLAGVPVIAHNSGGPKETIEDGKTGVLFDALSTSGLIEAIKRSELLQFDSEYITQHAQKFSKEEFKTKLKKLIEKAHPAQ